MLFRRGSLLIPLKILSLFSLPVDEISIFKEEDIVGPLRHDLSSFNDASLVSPDDCHVIDSIITAND